MKSVVVRTISGTVFVAVMLLCLLTSSRLFGLLIAFMAFGMCYEYLTMPSKAGLKLGTTQHIIYSLSGVLYILCGLAFMIVLAFRGGEFSGLLPLSFFLMIWASDVGAYCVGSTLGQAFHSRKMAPKISPNKTWAGFIGGMVFCLAAAALLQATGLLEMSLITSLVLGVVVHCTGVAGDLLESLWKRRFGVKDSGNLIPGHGGLLDRFDSSLLAFPAGAILLLLLKLI